MTSEVYVDRLNLIADIERLLKHLEYDDFLNDEDIIEIWDRLHKLRKKCVKEMKENDKKEKAERERIKGIISKHWNIHHPNYPSKLSYLFALIDGEVDEGVQENK